MSISGPELPVRVLLVDDQALIRAGFAMILGTREDLEVVGEAATGDEAVRFAAELRPDVILMDIRMPVLDGIGATRLITGTRAPEGHAPRVVILTTYDLDEYVYDALAAGASGFLLKDVPPEELVRAVLVVAGGEVLVQVARGLSNSEIAEALFVSSHTVKTHLAHVLDKLGAHDRVHAVIYAYEAGIVKPGPRAGAEGS